PPPDASSLPRKRPREELPNPICGESDLTRPSPASTEESSKVPQTISKESEGKSYSFVAGARPSPWFMEEVDANIVVLPAPMQEDVILNPRCPKISFSEDELRSFFKPWSKALVVRVLERKFSFGAVKRRLETLWAKSGHIQVSDIASSSFLVRFSTAEDYHRAAFEGPWKIYDFYFSVTRWTPSFNEDEPLKTILTWVRLPKLPIHFFNRVAVTRIGNFIGKTVRLDLATSEGARARYARVCVEVDISKPLIGKFMIDERTYYVIYESLENICAECGMYGHKADCCLLRTPPVTNHDKSEETVKETESKVEGAVGDWMIVQRKSRAKNNKLNQPSTRDGPTGSRFDILADSEVTAEPEGTPHVDGVTMGGKQFDTITTSLASNLAAALAQAPCMQDDSTVKTGKSKTQLSARKPLTEVSNDAPKIPKPTRVTVEGVLDGENTPSLVNVPILYDNPTFQGIQRVSNNVKAKKQTPKRDKGLASRERALVTEKKDKKEGKPTRSFGPRKADARITKNDEIRVDKPPDRS
ncbi:hypothetical protein LINPERHAP2_LOCUS35530, partial [Linum perenne]